ncbi:MAG: hypothetical protein ACLTDR_02615 [Adlercreutzia equolifaciens]
MVPFATSGGSGLGKAPERIGPPDVRRHRAARQAPQRRPERHHAAHVDRELVDRPPSSKSFLPRCAPCMARAADKSRMTSKYMPDNLAERN